MAAEDGSRDLVTADIILPSSKVNLSQLSSNHTELKFFRCISLQETMQLNLMMVEWTLLDTRMTGRLFSGGKVTRYSLILHLIHLMRLGWNKMLLLEGWPAAGCDPQRGRKGGRWVWHPVPVHQHCLCSWYLKNILFLPRRVQNVKIYTKEFLQ